MKGFEWRSQERSNEAGMGRDEALDEGQDWIGGVNMMDDRLENCGEHVEQATF